MTLFVFKCGTCGAIVLRDQTYPQPFCKEHPAGEMAHMMVSIGQLETT